MQEIILGTPCISSLSLSLIPWVIWWILIDKKRLPEIILLGLLIMVPTVVLDNIGTDLMWWEYPDKFFQMVPPLLPADLTLVPCSMMLICQYVKILEIILNI